MRIIIIGDGKVGFTIASQLVRECHDVVMIDRDMDALSRANDSLDVLCIRGNGLRSSVLLEAGVREADLLIAVTNQDEVNMVACFTGKKLGAKYTIARIRDLEYAEELAGLKQELELDLVINPEQATATAISQLLRFPSAIKVDTFARGRAEMAGFVVGEQNPFLHIPLHELTPRLSGPVLFALVQRGEEASVPSADYAMQPGDRVHVVGRPKDISIFFGKLGHPRDLRAAMIVGGGRIAGYLGPLLVRMGAKVKIVERQHARCLQLSEHIPDALIIHGDGADSELLQSEDVGDMDAFIAVTDRDEDNLIASYFALSAGAGRVVTKVNHLTDMSIMRKLGIDSVLSPRQITADEIVRFCRALAEGEGCPIEALHRVADGQAEVLEFTAGKRLHYLNIPLEQLTMRSGMLVALIVRAGQVIIPRGQDSIREGDSVLVINARGTVPHPNEIFDEVRGQ